MKDFDDVSFYAAHPDVIAVAASTSRDEHAAYSNRRQVSVCAPSNGDWPVISARAWYWEWTESWKLQRSGETEKPEGNTISTSEAPPPRRR